MMPWTVNESYKHLITGLVLHEAEKKGVGGVAYPGYIPLSFKRKVTFVCFLSFPQWVSHWRPSAVLAIYNTDQLKASMELIPHLLEDAVESLHFFLSPLTTSCWTAPCLCYCWFCSLTSWACIVGVTGSTLGPPNSQLFTPLSMPSAQHHFFVRTPPEL